ncbi:glycosyltransferase family protein [Endozoicomonas sp. ALB032]|uniref:glycosyltransferase family protein n=1 Tax=Endozoicomonas sp. ALB032 TaxID=3403082 RepID=UPI003BB7C200
MSSSGCMKYTIGMLIQYEKQYLLGNITFPEVQNYFEYRKYCDIKKDIDIRIVTKHGEVLSTDLKEVIGHYKKYNFDFILFLEQYPIFDTYIVSLNWLPQRFLTGELFRTISDQYIHGSSITKLIKNIDIYGKFYFPNKQHRKLIRTASSFYTFNPNVQCLTPKIVSLASPKIFYLAASDPLIRHKDLIYYLDRNYECAFFGPKEKWIGINNYKGKISHSMIYETINRMGIVLAIHNPIHCAYSFYTNRIFEAIIGGAVVITDEFDNIKEIFGDSLFYINNDNNIHTALEIIKIAEHIRKNPQIMRNKILESQRIFHEVFLKKDWIIDACENILREKNEYIKTITESKKNIDVLYICKESSTSYYNIKSVVDQIKNQYFKNLILIICCTIDTENKIIELNKKNNCLDGVNFKFSTVKAINDIDINHTGHLFVESLRNIESEYFTVIDFCTKWHKDHLGRLIWEMENSEKDVLCAYSECYISDRNYSDSSLGVNHSLPITLSDIFSIVDNSNFINTATEKELTYFERNIEIKFLKGCQLFHYNTIELIRKEPNTDHFKYVDSYEHILILYLIIINTSIDKLLFVRYTTCGKVIPSWAKKELTNKIRSSLNPEPYIRSVYSGTFNCNACGIYERVLDDNRFWELYSKHNTNFNNPPISNNIYYALQRKSILSLIKLGLTYITKRLIRRIIQ